MEGKVIQLRLSMMKKNKGWRIPSFILLKQTTYFLLGRLNPLDGKASWRFPINIKQAP